MSATQPRDVGELDKAVSVDQHGIEPIPDRDRDSTAWQQFWIWFGANISVLGLSYGAFALGFGISFWQAALVTVVGVIVSFALCGITVVELRDGRARLRAHNLEAHLGELAG